MAKIVKEVKQVFGFLGEDQDFSKKQLTLTSWGVYSPKFDIRTWSEDYERYYILCSRIDCSKRFAKSAST